MPVSAVVEPNKFGEEIENAIKKEFGERMGFILIATPLKGSPRKDVGSYKFVSNMSNVKDRVGLVISVSEDLLKLAGV